MTRTTWPAVLPRVGLAAGASVAALAGPLWLAGTMAVAGWVVLETTRGRVEGRHAVAVAFGLAAATLLLTPIWLVWGVDLTWGAAVAIAAAIAVRLAAVALVGGALAARVPARVWLAAAYRTPRLGLALALTFRQVPELAADAGRIRRAQRARGLAAGPRLVHPRAVAIPLVLAALERADRMGRALALAGWGEGTRVPATRTAWRATDVGVVVAGAFLTAAPWLLAHFASS